MASKSQTSRKGTSIRKGRTSTGRRAKDKGQAHGDRPTNPNVLERGDIFFFYRPDAEGSPPGGLLDVNRFHLVLRPEGKDLLRYITVGKKKLPGAGDDSRNWAFVDRILDDPEELRAELAGTEDGDGAQVSRGRAAARPAGEGVYALVRSGRRTVLAYALELPQEPSEVQQALHIEPQGRFVLVVKNPEAASPEGLGLDQDRKADFPEELKARFGDRKWTGADPPEFLDYEGAELVLIGGEDGVEDLGIDLEPQPEDEEHAEVFTDLHLEKSERILRPLFEGTWE
jgi:hypothetical protein